MFQINTATFPINQLKNYFYVNILLLSFISALSVAEVFRNVQFATFWMNNNLVLISKMQIFTQ